ncbi:hypothetical protein BD289DRAFT_444029 [Coniella lustricola]|uniref:Uncharacterized protein n=1 Tax=Coniella lustricola TaxID=2025994 RepID=A0A2T2ZWA4_9PEZI|nr:hypothetical protein BD289DRAFT_444029 [Coniella lustricola]
MASQLLAKVFNKISAESAVGKLFSVACLGVEAGIVACVCTVPPPRSHGPRAKGQGPGTGAAASSQGTVVRGLVARIAGVGASRRPTWVCGGCGFLPGDCCSAVARDVP